MVFFVPLAAAAATTAASAGTAAISLSTIATGLSIGSALVGGYMNYQQGQSQAAYSRMQARQALLQGMKQENDIREAMLRSLAANAARFGAAGLDIGSGTPATLENEIWRQANYELGVTRDNADIKAGGYRTQAGQQSVGSYGALAQGVAGAGEGLYQMATR